MSSPPPVSEQAKYMAHGDNESAKFMAHEYARVVRHRYPDASILNEVNRYTSISEWPINLRYAILMLQRDGDFWTLLFLRYPYANA